ncbi:MAG: nitrous oxide reductase accessory protein NosL [Microscillaceae bacterium]|nr:nitrous oxide reductase accessory protein NosL [Microscillaceae bacterium]
MKLFSLKILAGFFLTLLFSCAQTKQDHSQHQGHSTSPQQTSESSAVNTDCQYCGMPSAEFPKWQSKLSTKEGEKYCCSPRCMFLTVLDPKQTVKNIQKIEVIDFYDTKPIDARKAFYVIKSDVLGPMGSDLVPHRDKTAAEEFMKDHQGSKILRFEEVDLDMIKQIIQN